MTRKCSLFIIFFAITYVSSAQDQKREPYFKTRDSVKAPTSLKYDDPSFIKKFLLGKNYRKEWSTPVTAPVFRLSQSQFTIKELGGGQQTKSLKLNDKEGREWALRSLDKEVTYALPEKLRGTIAQRVTQDMISGAYPQGALVVGGLAKAAGIPAPEPQLYYVVSDPAMGELDSLFANTFCYLEERHPTYDKTKTEDTEDVLEEIAEENDNLVLQKQVLKARLLDMLVSDWDRHADQWAWGEKDSADNKYFYAIPRDRDQAFFYSRGFLVSLARVFGLRHLVGFRSSTRKVKNLNYKAWNFDRVFLNELDESDWKEVLTGFQRSLPDEVISAAVQRLPKEIYAISGPEIEKKLRDRRDGLSRDALRYYEFISQQLTVNGTEQKEHFTIENQDGRIFIKVTDQKKNRLYERIVDPKTTRLIYLNGMGNEDSFEVGENVSRKARIIINGGKGKDNYDVKSKIRGHINDYRSETSEFRNHAEERLKYLTE